MTITFAAPLSHLDILSPAGWADYELIDSGGSRKLERFGPYVLDRPESNALWLARENPSTWNQADARFTVPAGGGMGDWEYARPLPDKWRMGYPSLDLAFWVGCRPFRHTGLFPEQAAHWDWLAACALACDRPLKVLVLFGYTALATLALAHAGAQVTHVDASRPMTSWARANADASGLTGRPVRWIVEDALAFLRREARRGARYDGIVVDPPAFGRGPNGETWRFHISLPELMSSCVLIMSENPRFFLINAYAVPASATMLANMVQDIVPPGGILTAGELALAGGGRTLSTGIYARWQSP